MTTRKPWEHAKSSGSEADPSAARFVCSLDYDTRLYHADIRGSLAHAQMLEKVGLITEQDLRAITSGLDEIRQEIEASEAGPFAVGVPGAWHGWKTELEDVHMCVEAALIEKVGDPGRKLHTGRSRNDQVATDLRLWIADASQQLHEILTDVTGAFEHLVETQGDTPLPSYTHLQRAQPSTVGAECLAWHAMLSRDREDALSLKSRALAECPLGSGAIAGTSLPIDRVMTAEALGFARPSPSSIDATASRDEALDMLYLLSRTTMHLSRLAEQWIIYCSAEFGFLTLAPAYTTGSSMMPQKRNPDMLELVRGSAGAVFGSLTALLTTCKGLTVGYNRDLQSDKQHLFRAYDTARDALRITANMVRTARFDASRIRAAAGGLDAGFPDATSLAEYLVTRGVPFRTAHQIVGVLVEICETTGLGSLSRLPLDAVRDALGSRKQDPDIVTDELSRWLGFDNVVARYRSLGHAGTGAGGAHDTLGLARPRAPEPGAQTSGPGSQAGSDRGEPQPALFNDTEAPEPSTRPDALTGAVLGAYVELGRTLDDLPYTPEFEQIFTAAHAHDPAMTRKEVFHRLQNLRKAGRLPRSGKAFAPPPRIAPQDEEWFTNHLIDMIGSLGARDQLPYTTVFDKLVEDFHAQTGSALSPHDVWRIIAKLAK